MGGQTKYCQLFASATRTTAVANQAGDTFECMTDRAVVLLDVTAMGGVAGDTLDVYVDVLAPDGATWLNAVHFPQIAGNGAAAKHWAVLDASAPGTSTIAVTSDASAGAARPYLVGRRTRGRYTLVDAGAHGQSATFSLHFLNLKD